MEHLAVSHIQSTIIKKRKNKKLKNLYLGLLFTYPFFWDIRFLF